MVQHGPISFSHSSAVALEGRRHRLGAGILANAILDLIKIRITFFVGMSAVFGYVVATGDLSVSMILPVLGIFLLSCASAATNHYQERYTDSLMHRTNRRPLPAGIMSPASVLVFISVLALAGSATILFSANSETLLLSWLAFVSYNIVYTPLKKATPYAVIPGSFVGSLPVMAGWAAAGGRLTDPRLLAVAAFFFIWQIPHFWLLMELYDSDYRRAGFPTLRSFYGAKSIGVLIFSLTAALALSSVFLLTSRVVENIFPQMIVIGLGVWLLFATYEIIYRNSDRRRLKSAFLKINVYVLAITLVVMVDLLIKKI